MKGLVISPKVWQYMPEDPRELQVQTDRDGNLIIECEVISPPSMAAKTRPPVLVEGRPFGGGTEPAKRATFYVPAELVPALMKAAREAAIELRSKPMEAENVTGPL
jgi:hypothetical protein